MIERLNAHSIIGLDLDETLIGHPKSYLLHEHVKENSEKKFWIITHRSHGLVPRIWTDLEMFTDLVRSDFEGFKSVADKLYEKYTRDEIQRQAGILTGELTDNEKEYLSWKGMICKQLGCTVLVDDKPKLNQLGTDRYNIELINTHEL